MKAKSFNPYQWLPKSEWLPKPDKQPETGGISKHKSTPGIEYDIVSGQFNRYLKRFRLLDKVLFLGFRLLETVS
jgi:hypothetical protein